MWSYRFCVLFIIAGLWPLPKENVGVCVYVRDCLIVNKNSHSVAVNDVVTVRANQTIHSLFFIRMYVHVYCKTGNSCLLF